jgi:hypothetical protein
LQKRNLLTLNTLRSTLNTLRSNTEHHFSFHWQNESSLIFSSPPLPSYLKIAYDAAEAAETLPPCGVRLLLAAKLKRQ